MFSLAKTKNRKTMMYGFQSSTFRRLSSSAAAASTTALSAPTSVVDNQANDNGERGSRCVFYLLPRRDIRREAESSREVECGPGVTDILIPPADTPPVGPSLHRTTVLRERSQPAPQAEDDYFFAYGRATPPPLLAVRRRTSSRESSRCKNYADAVDGSSSSTSAVTLERARPIRSDPFLLRNPLFLYNKYTICEEEPTIVANHQNLFNEAAEETGAETHLHRLGTSTNGSSSSRRELRTRAGTTTLANNSTNRSGPVDVTDEESGEPLSTDPRSCNSTSSIRSRRESRDNTLFQRSASNVLSLRDLLHLQEDHNYFSSLRDGEEDVVEARAHQQSSEGPCVTTTTTSSPPHNTSSQNQHDEPRHSTTNSTIFTPQTPRNHTADHLHQEEAQTGSETSFFSSSYADITRRGFDMFSSRFRSSLQVAREASRRREERGESPEASSLSCSDPSISPTIPTRSASCGASLSQHHQQEQQHTIVSKLYSAPGHPLVLRRHSSSTTRATTTDSSSSSESGIPSTLSSGSLSSSASSPSITLSGTPTASPTTSRFNVKKVKSFVRTPSQARVIQQAGEDDCSLQLHGQKYLAHKQTSPGRLTTTTSPSSRQSASSTAPYVYSPPGSQSSGSPPASSPITIAPGGGSSLTPMVPVPSTSTSSAAAPATVSTGATVPSSSSSSSGGATHQQARGFFGASRPHLSINITRKHVVRENHQTFNNVYDLAKDGDSMLGEGAFGTVVKAIHRTTGIVRAAKKIPKTALEDQRLFENEVETLMQLDHPHIVKLVEYFEEKDQYILIFELCQGPDLFDRIVDVITDRQAFDEVEAGRLLRHMLKAILCCHSHKIIHRDIKPENFMFNRPDPRSSLKMIDLGLSELYKEDGFLGKTATPIGTIAYMSPEMLLGERYDRQCDIWSLGVILWAMLMGEPLFTHECDKLCEEQILDLRFLEGEMKKALGKMTPEAHELLTRMLQRDPKLRISAAEALSHPFILKSYSPSDYADRSATENQHRAGSTKALFDTKIVEKMECFVNQPALKRVGTFVFAHLCGTDSEEMRTLRLTFRQLDKKGLGMIKKEELVYQLRERGISVPEDFSERVMPYLDSNKSDVIDFIEFLAATIDVKKVRNYEQILKGVFQLMDTNSSGYLALDDMADLLCHNSLEQLEAMVLQVAPSGQMSFEEFKEMMLD